MSEDLKFVRDDSSTPTLKSSEPPSSDLKSRWKKPTSVREFAAQVNAISTKFLNGEVDFNTATGYARLARTYAQLMGIEATKSRLDKGPLDLKMPEYDEEE